MSKIENNFPFFFEKKFRSPSPEPIYSSDGKRLNTRDYRKRKELEESRHGSIQRMLAINPEYKPPPDYKYVDFTFILFHLGANTLITLAWFFSYF